MLETVMESFRLSPLQRHLCALHCPGTDFPYRTHCTIRLEGPLNICRLLTAFRCLVERYEILHTVFPRLPGLTLPVQVIADFYPPLPIYDLSSLPHQEQEEIIPQLQDSTRSRPINLETGPILQATLIVCTPQRRLLLLDIPALNADIATCHILVHDLSLFYESDYPENTIQEEPLQYADLAEWQYELLESPETAAGRIYWRSPEHSLLMDIPLPYEQTVIHSSSFAPHTLSLRLPASFMAQVEALTQRLDVSPAALFLTCWASVLWRLTNRADLLIGTGYDGRKYQELAEAVGLFAKYLPLSYHLSVEASFSDAVLGVEARLREAYQWQEYFSWEQLEAITENGQEPFSAFAFDYHTLPSSSRAAELLFIPDDQDTYHDRFKVRLSCQCSTDELLVRLYYDQRLFQEQDMVRLLMRWQTVLLQAVDMPQTALELLEVLTHEERELLLEKWNATQASYPKEVCIHHLVEMQAERTPESIAVVFEEAQVSYQELNSRANRVAHYLRQSGVKPEVRVGLCMERSITMMVGLLGILKAGGAYVPLDPIYPAERLAFMLQNAMISILLTQERLLKKISAVEVQMVCLDRDWELVARESAEQPESEVMAGNLAYVIYTSGSTGQPKGVMISHQGLVNYLSWCTSAYTVANGSGTLVHSPLTFDLTLTSLFPPLLVGLPVILLPEAHGIEELANALQTSTYLSLVKLTPAHLDILQRLLGPETASGRTQSFIIGGEALNGETLTFWRLHAPDTRLINEYGPTETVVGCCVYEVPAEAPLDGPVPIGRPIANTRLYLLDQQLQPVPIGMIAELYIGGDGLARGYLNQPGLTAVQFIPDPFSTASGERLYKTGDLARYLPDGTLVFLGRQDHQVKVRGYRIELAEIEATLIRHPLVREAVVLVREAGAGEKRLEAYVVGTEPEVALAASELRKYLQEKLPDYMVPAFFTVLEAMPLTSNGKVDRAALPSAILKEAERDLAGGTPRTIIEEIVSAIWCEVLGCSQASIHDNFFDAGGHSLLATRLISRIQAVLGIEISLRGLFETPTIAGLAQQVEQALRGEQMVEAPPLVPALRMQDLPLSFAQQRLWFLDRLDPESIIYLMPDARRLHGILDTAALERSLQALMQRHESLRTTFEVREGQPVQVIHPASVFHLPLLDLSGLAEEKRAREAHLLAQQEAHRPFDLTVGPLLRTYLLRLEVQQHVLLLTLHHIISDGWSNDIFYRELTTLYRAFASGQPSPLPPLPIQYADFALWQRQWLQGEVLEAQLAYWRQQLVEVPPLKLPTDYPRPSRQTFRGAFQGIHLPVALHEQLLSLSHQEDVTLFMLLLAAFQVLLARYSGQSDISVGTAIANRTRAELEGLIGFFVNTLVLRTNLSGNPTFIELLQRVREVALGAYVHQDIPFEQLVEELQPERDLSRSPLFQVAFGVQQTLETPTSQTTNRSEGLTLSGLNIEHTTTKFDLTLNIVSNRHGLHCGVEYNIDLFEASTISRLLEHWHILLTSIVADPQHRLAELRLLSEAEYRTLLVDWNADPPAIPETACLPQLFARQVARYPEAVAVVSEETTLSYAALDRYANQLAHCLQALGVGPEVLVGVYVDRSAVLLICLLAVLKAGGGYVPLDPTYPLERLAMMLAGANVPLVLTRQWMASSFPQGQARQLCLESLWEQMIQQPVEAPASDVQPDNAAYVIYTSGSTGKPKGVVVTHRGLNNLAQAQADAFAVGRESHVLQWAALSFDASLAEIIVTLLAGACLDLASHERLLPGPALLQVLQERAITVITLPPSALAALPLQPLPTLETLVVAGEACSAGLVEQWAGGRRMYNAYGPTEASVCASLGPCVADGRAPSIGRPLPQVQLYLLDAELQPVPVGVPGELYIGGIGLARGYVNLPEQAAERFIPDPFSGRSGSRLYKTSDHARYRADGQLEYVGRSDQQIKLRGYRIEPGEIEAVLQSHSTVQAAIVLLQEEGNEAPRLVAWIMGKPEVELPDTQQWHQYLREWLPDYMLPAAFIAVDAWPLTPTGKVDRRALAMLERQQEWLSDETDLPQTPTENLLAEIWCQLLGRSQVGIHDDFFGLGGHSLLATRLMGRVQRVLQVDLPVQTVFEFPTIAELAAIIEQKQSVLIHQTESEELEQMLVELEELSEEEIQTILTTEI